MVHTHTYTPTHTHTRRHIKTHYHAHAVAHTIKQSFSLYFTFSPFLAFSHSHAHTHTHTYAQTSLHAHTLVLFPPTALYMFISVSSYLKIRLIFFCIYFYSVLSIYIQVSFHIWVGLFWSYSFEFLAYFMRLRCSVLQYVAVCCSMLQCDVECCSAA